MVRRMERVALYVMLVFVGFCLVAVARRDWVRLTRPTRCVDGAVVGHRERVTVDGRSYAAIYAFAADGGEHRVVDAVYSGAPRPAVGVHRMLAFPDGHPELARPPRPVLTLLIYGVLVGGLGAIVAALMGLFG